MPLSEKVRHNYLSDERWKAKAFVGRPLSSPWRKAYRPTLQLSDSRLLLAIGNELVSYEFTPSAGVSGPFNISLPKASTDRQHDITSLVFLPDGGANRKICVSYADGSIVRMEISLGSSTSLSPPVPIAARRTAVYGHSNAHVQHLSSCGQDVMSLSTSKMASLFRADAPWTTPTTLNLPFSPWVSLLRRDASSPYAAIGMTARDPKQLLHIYPISETNIRQNPSVVLTGGRSAVYGLAKQCEGSPLGSSDQIVISGWYDGHVVVHDLRSRSRSNSDSLDQTLITSLRPVIMFRDPFWNPIYTVASGGGCSAHIAAGTARHSIVSIWDVRSPSSGWSVYGPGLDHSPVYSLALEGSRVWAATHKRAFVLDFGPDVGRNTYPHVPSHGSKIMPDGIAHEAPVYVHQTMYRA
jgi:hypothetical protein